MNSDVYRIARSARDGPAWYWSDVPIAFLGVIAFADMFPGAIMAPEVRPSFLFGMDDLEADDHQIDDHGGEARAR
jgi:hypothetical protein